MSVIMLFSNAQMPIFMVITTTFTNASMRKFQTAQVA